MKKLASGLVAGTAALALGVPLTLGALPSASAAPSADGSGPERTSRPDNLPGPLTAEQDALREKALAALEQGAELRRSADGGAVVAVPEGAGTSRGKAKGKGRERGAGGTAFYEFPVDRTDKVLTMLSQFGGSGPAANEIPEPDRETDNSTYWVPDFDQAHFDELFNGEGRSFRTYFRDVSSGRYDVSVTTEDWVTVPGDAATYGANDVEYEGGIWAFVTETADAWYAEQLAAGKSEAEIADYLRAFDQWDRYDHDGDGDFNEADGYVDHFQAVHAGMGEEAGGGAQGADAIWSHRWYVNPGDYGQTGPQSAPFGGTEIGDSGIWIGDYTVEPENGGLGVFTHEYAHDLGLPDYYDTAGGDNSTGFWTLMSSGSWLGDGAAAGEGIGTVPNGMGPQEKYELGWLDHTVVEPGQQVTGNLAPAIHTYDKPKTPANEADQAIKVNLPDKTTTVDYTVPFAGAHAWWGGRANGLNNTLTREVPAAGAVSVTAQVWHEIESGYDYLYGEYSTDGGTTWADAGTPIDGTSEGLWVPRSWSYDAGGKPSLFRFRYYTDGGVNEAGAFLDQITLTAGSLTETEGAEGTTSAWQAAGFTRSTGSDTKVTDQYYLLENRQYVDWDATLRTGPYNFHRGITAPDMVEFFSFRPGMLVWYVDAAYADNNTSDHPGHGAALPVDARPAPMTWADGTKPTNRRQPFDAAFGRQGVPRTCLHKEVAGEGGEVETLAACAPASAAMPTFDDSDVDAYWSKANPWGSTKVAGAGVRATVLTDKQGVLRVRVTNPAS